MNPSKSDTPPAPKPETDASEEKDREPMDEAKARKALHKIAEVQEKLEPRG